MNNKTKYLVIFLSVVLVFGCQPEKKETESEHPKNIIFLIGDGMGVSHIYAGMTANHGPLAMEQFRHIGFIKTYSSNSYVTDSGASGTAMSSGKKTKNGMIGMDPDTIVLRSVLEIAEEHGLASGLVSTSSITHATPAAFIAHQPSRNMYEEIAADFLKTEIDVFIGGGRDHFMKREDGRDLTKELEERGYNILFDMDKISGITEGKLAGLTADAHNPRYSEGRGDMLPDATVTAMKILNNNKKGFFLMVEGSQIDWGGHANSTEYIIEEVLDFDRAVAKALEFAQNDGETLVVVTADHETGGLGINGGNFENGTVEGGFTTKGHTGVMVPVFAYGPGAKEFTGIYENTALFDKFLQAYGFSGN
ncbi:Alkaline phosphatase 4 [subsurface metagenome]